MENPEETVIDQVETPNPENKETVYTQEELDAKIQAETDRRVNEALEKKLAKERKKFEQELAEKTQEAEKLAKMSEADRAQAKFDKERQAFEAEKQEFARQKLAVETEKTLIAEGLPSQFSKYVIGDDAEATHANIKAFREEWTQALEEAASKKLDEKIQSNTKTPGSSNGSVKGMTSSEFNALPYSERIRLRELDPTIGT